MHLSTGDMLRAAVASGSELGVAARGHMDAGALVPDALVIDLVLERVTRPDAAARGWLLDGFPRTSAQARALDAAGVLPDAVVCLDVEDEKLVERVVGRRLDPVSGEIYHVDFNPPPPGEVADRCVRRGDDTEEKARARLDAFHKNTEAIERQYKDVVTRVDGARGKMDVFADVRAVVDAVVEEKEKSDVGGGGGGGGGASATAAAGTASAEAGAAKEGTGTGSGMPISEFVRRAEDAFDKGYLSTEDTNYSGQAAAEGADSDGTRSYSDLGRRWPMAVGDLGALLAFAYIGHAAHAGQDGGGAASVLQTAAPFLLSWFLISPPLGAYTRAATCNVKTAFTASFLPVVASTGGGLAVRCKFFFFAPVPLQQILLRTVCMLFHSFSSQRSLTLIWSFFPFSSASFSNHRSLGRPSQPTAPVHCCLPPLHSAPYLRMACYLHVHSRR